VSIKWSRRAASDLEAVVAHIMEDDRATAQQGAGRITLAVEKLAVFPGLGRPGRVQATRELSLAGLPYIVIYQTEKQDVAILRILHARMQWP